MLADFRPVCVRAVGNRRDGIFAIGGPIIIQGTAYFGQHDYLAGRLGAVNGIFGNRDRDAHENGNDHDHDQELDQCETRP